jgi:hypothetical protein
MGIGGLGNSPTRTPWPVCFMSTVLIQHSEARPPGHLTENHRDGRRRLLTRTRSPASAIEGAARRESSWQCIMAFAGGGPSGSDSDDAIGQWR